MRIKSHESSAKYESRNAPKVKLPSVKIGDRIFIKSDGSKSKARDPYLVLSFVPNKNEIEAQKILDTNRKNIVRVHLQNVYPVESDDENLEPNDDLSRNLNDEQDSEEESGKERQKKTSERKT